MNSLLTERVTLMAAQAVGPADINGAAFTGEYIHMRSIKRLVAVVYAGVGTAAKDLALTIYQATSVAGAGAKALNCLVTGRVLTKESATALDAVADWTAPTIATATNTYTSLTSGESACLYAVEILPEALDTANGFCAVAVAIADPTAAKITGLLYLAELKEAGDATLAPTVVA